MPEEKATFLGFLGAVIVLGLMAGLLSYGAYAIAMSRSGHAWEVLAFVLPVFAAYMLICLVANPDPVDANSFEFSVFPDPGIADDGGCLLSLFILPGTLLITIISECLTVIRRYLRT